MNPHVLRLPKNEILTAAEQFKTPFFLYSEAKIRENCRRYREAFREYFPDFQPFYAVKANPNPEILKIILEEGFYLDTSSPSEVFLAKKLNAHGMYTGNYTPPEELEYAKKQGLVLNLDDISMIPFLEKIGVPETLSFRINPGIGNGGMKSLVVAGPDAKFGMPFEKAAEAYSAAKKLGIQKFGIHMMTGSNILDASHFPKVVQKLFEVVAEIHSQTGIEIEFMNIGGGFGVPYAPEEKSLDMNAIAKEIHKVITDSCEKYSLKQPRLMAEPGRYITADAGWLISRILLRKESYKTFVGIDASSNDMPRPSIYGAYHHISVLNSTSSEEKVSVVGRICENNDQFAQDRILPISNIGDVVVIHNCGAHAYAMGHNYNGRMKHAEYLLQTDGKFRQIRRSETIEDLFATLNFE